MTTLTATGLTVRRQGKSLLNEVSFEAHAGDFIAVIGANGAGKSTLLAVLAGLLKPCAGSVTLDGRTLARFTGTQLARRRAYLPQNARCEWPLPVERLVALGLTPHLPALGGLPRSFGPHIEAALALCDLIPMRLQPATTLSGGELARAMLARALVGDPDVLIVDEPTSGLDPRHMLDAATRLRALAQGGKLVIAAVHDLTLAARYATRVIALRNGRLAGEGMAREALTPELLRRVFDVEASVATTAAGPFVDYLPIAASAAAAPEESRWTGGAA